MTRGKLKSLFSLPDTLPAIFSPFSFFHFFSFHLRKTFFRRMMYDSSLERRHAARTDCGTPSLLRCFMDCGPKPTDIAIWTLASLHLTLAMRRDARHSSAQLTAPASRGLGRIQGLGLWVGFFSALKKLDRSTSVPLFHTIFTRQLVMIAVKASKTVWLFTLEFIPKMVKIIKLLFSKRHHEVKLKDKSSDLAQL